MLFAAREALRIVLDEGLEPRWSRHAQASNALRAGLASTPRGARDDDRGELRLFDPDPRAGAPPVELLVTDHKSWDDAPDPPGLAGLAERPWRAAEARQHQLGLMVPAIAVGEPGLAMADDFDHHDHGARAHHAGAALD